jgi:CelD/BcsL family acetyltransferase involved in cellulose biosynthesis
MALSVDLSPLDDLAALEAEWRALEAEAEPNFFLSWTWMAAVLGLARERPLVLRARDGNRLMALAWLSPVSTRRHLIVRSRQLWLHETGNPALDRITIEHNGFLVRKGSAPDLMQNVFISLLHQRQNLGWDEIVLGGVGAAILDAAQQAGLTPALDRQSNTYAVPLAHIRASGKTWLDTLSRNTRSKVQQACRFAAQSGPLTINAARDLPEAMDFFERMRALHQERWKQAPAGGAFSTNETRAFHTHLITAGMANGTIELLRVSAGDQPLGYLYNLISGNAVYNYQSGFQRQDDNRHRPGLVAHRLCIERALAAGFGAYDLLAGDMRYKRSIAEAGPALFWARAQAAHPILAAERMARAVKAKLLKA